MAIAGDFVARFPRPRLGCTSICALVLLPITAALFLAVALGDPLEWLDRPNASVLQVSGSNLLLDEALTSASALERRLSLLGRFRRIHDGEALARLEEARRFHRPTPELLGGIAILHGEAGRADVVAEIASQIAGEAPRLAETLLFAYAGLGSPAADAATWPRAPGVWFRTVLAERVALRRGDDVEAERQRTERADATSERLRRTAGLGAGRALLWMLALGGIVAWLVSGRRPVRLADARLGDGWPPALGTAVLVRGVLWAVLVTMALAGAGAASGQPLLQMSLPALTAALPFLALVRTSLLVPQGIGFRAAFGLRLGGSGLARAAAIAVAALGVQQAGAAIILFFMDGGRPGLASHWSEAVAEEFLWGTGPVALLSAINLLVAIPWVEEIAFRGVLYSTLRDRMRARSAALLSATVYAAFHLIVAAVAAYPVHSPVAVAVVLWSGLVWAAVYEKTRSLVPCVLAHAGANALSVLGTWLVYR